MSTHAEKCPVCGGSGGIRQDIESGGWFKFSCHGCNGIGWITVEDNDEHIIDYNTTCAPRGEGTWIGINCDAHGSIGIPEPQYLTAWTETEIDKTNN